MVNIYMNNKIEKNYKAYLKLGRLREKGSLIGMYFKI